MSDANKQPKKYISPMDDCPVDGCKGVVIVVHKNTFRCTQGHVAIYESGTVTFPKPPRPSTRRGYGRASGGNQDT